LSVRCSVFDVQSPKALVPEICVPPLPLQRALCYKGNPKRRLRARTPVAGAYRGRRSYLPGDAIRQTNRSPASDPQQTSRTQKTTSNVAGRLCTDVESVLETLAGRHVDHPSPCLRRHGRLSAAHPSRLSVRSPLISPETRLYDECAGLLSLKGCLLPYEGILQNEYPWLLTQATRRQDHKGRLYAPNTRLRTSDRWLAVLKVSPMQPPPRLAAPQTGRSNLPHGLHRAKPGRPPSPAHELSVDSVTQWLQRPCFRKEP